MTLEEIKAAIVERVDAAWTEIEHEVDADKVRVYVQGLTAELVSHVYAIEAHLVDHVLGKQDSAPAPEPTPVPDQPTEPPVTGPEDGAAPVVDPVADGTEPSQG